MRLHPLALLLPLVLAVACTRRKPPEPRAMIQKTMQGVIVYPRSTTVSVGAGEDAAQMTLSTVDSIAPVAGWFRQALQLNGWTLVSDVTGADGSITMSATKGKRPLWITLHPNVGAPGTTYTVIGAVVDSTVGDSGGTARKSPAP